MKLRCSSGTNQKTKIFYKKLVGKLQKKEVIQELDETLLERPYQSSSIDTGFFLVIITFMIRLSLLYNKIYIISIR